MAPRTPSQPVAQARGRVAALTRARAADDVELVDARRTLKAAKAEEYIAGVVAGWPSLTTEQTDKLVAILRREEVAK